MILLMVLMPYIIFNLAISKRRKRFEEVNYELERHRSKPNGCILSGILFLIYGGVLLFLES